MDHQSSLNHFKLFDSSLCILFSEAIPQIFDWRNEERDNSDQYDQYATDHKGVADSDCICQKSRTQQPDHGRKHIDAHIEREHTPHYHRIYAGLDYGRERRRIKGAWYSADSCQ